jgi:hypothetical protein
VDAVPGGSGAGTLGQRVAAVPGGSGAGTLGQRVAAVPGGLSLTPPHEKKGLPFRMTGQHSQTKQHFHMF